MKDTIYRDDAINCCRNEWEEEVEERLSLLPSAQRWIPCSERLPKNNEDVLCCSYTGHFLIGIPYKSEPEIAAVTGYVAESDLYIMPNCIAWMPLPEPYEEVGADA